MSVCAYAVWFAWSLSGSAWLGGFAGIVLVASLSSFFFPTRYRLDADGVRVVNLLYRRTRPWSEFRGLSRQDNRLKLLTLPYDSRLDNYRGMLLILPDDTEPVLAFVRSRIERNDGGSP